MAGALVTTGTPAHGVLDPEISGYFTAAEQSQIIIGLARGRTVALNGTPGIPAVLLSRASDVTLYQAGVESTGPTCRVTAADVANYAVRHGSTITADGQTFYVIGINETRSGLVELLLSKDYPL